MKNSAGRILTVRLNSPLQRRLRARAQAERVTESALVRDLLERGLEQREAPEQQTVADRAGHLFGLIDTPDVPNGRDAKRHLKKWKPDRRG